jgi:hypothetical protein
MTTFVLVGPNAGKSGIWGGFAFKDGTCDVPDQHYTESVYNLLTGFYSAWPADEAEEKQAAYEQSQFEIANDDELAESDLADLEARLDRLDAFEAAELKRLEEATQPEEVVQPEEVTSINSKRKK